MTHKLNDEINRAPPDRQAHSYQLGFCSDPDCGLHLIALDDRGRAISEIVMSPKQTNNLVRVCQDFLYEKAVKKD